MLPFRRNIDGMNPKVEIKAWIVPVWTTNDPPMAFCWIAGYGDPIEAQEAVRRRIGMADIREPSPVSNMTADALGVRPGDAWLL
jgi:hypothetical protein